MRELSSCKSLSVLDLSHNLLEDPEVNDSRLMSILPIQAVPKVLEILASMPELHVLNMSNNHIQRTTGK